jgi:hypothetical protein
MIRKILFPFANKRPNLNKSVWHRLFVVLFFIGLILFFGWSWFAIINFENEPFQNCIDTAIYLGKNVDVDQCRELGGEVHHIPDLFISLILTIIASYLVQLMYFKVILYIILGKENVKVETI